MTSPPSGSKIKIEHEKGQNKLVIPHKSGGVLRIFMSLFLIFWLGGWAMGWIQTAQTIISGKSSDNAFLIFWLCGWTVGGIFAVWFLYRMLRPAVPEIMILGNQVMKYDSGIPPFRVSFGFVRPKDYWKEMFPKRHKVEFNADHLKSISLREHAEGNRLTIDYGAERHDLARGITEIEREWLYTTLKEIYS